MPSPFSCVSRTDRQPDVRSSNSSDPITARTVLVADGDDVHRASTAQLLSGQGYRVVQVSTGEAALSAILAGGIALLVSSVTMPQMDGLELLRILRNVSPELPVIAVVPGMAEIDGVYMRGASALGAAKTFIMPLTPSVFLASVGELLPSETH